VTAFDLAEHFQTPVIMLSDLDIGMNDWVVPRLQWDDTYRPDRGHVLTAEELETLPAFYRYLADGEEQVAPRTLPGVHSKGAFFTRGSGHNKYGAYTETPDEYQEVIDRLALKHAAASSRVPAPVIEEDSRARVGIITVGSCDLAVREAQDILRERGVPTSYVRIRGFPFDDRVVQFVEEHEVTFVVEQNRDGQLRSLLLLETPLPKSKLRSVRVYGGFPLSARPVVDEILEQLEV
jgi:2-oxoglutarate ferredoxin oxidoreductase subunit alpha